MRVKFEVQDLDHGWKELRKNLESLRGGQGAAKVGVVGPKASLEHPAEDGKPLSNADLAMIHEFGTDKVPERSFIRRAFDANRRKYLENLRTLVGAVYDRKLTIRRALSLLGQQGASDVREAIRAGIPPPNAPLTIARKGSSKPLIDTGQLIGAVTYEVDLDGKPDPDGHRES